MLLMHITNKKLKQEILDYRIQVEVRRRKPNILTHRKKKSLHLKTLGVRSRYSGIDRNMQSE